MYWKVFTKSALWELGKPRLSALVVLTTLSGYAVHKETSDENGSLTKMITTISGTGLCAYSANTLNQLLEYPMDAQMTRTRTRMLTSGRCLPLSALGCGLGAGILGITLLGTVNTKTAILGASTIGIYAFIYTPMKRFHHSSLWVGALVGAIPPLMGYTARNDSIDLKGLILPSILYFWQFPHFNSFSFFTKGSYVTAGYRLLCITKPFKNSQLAYKYSLRMLGFSLLLPLLDLQTSPYFILSSSFVNIPLAWYSARFHKSVNSALHNPDYFGKFTTKLIGSPESPLKASKRLFFTSLIHLPVLIALWLYHRSGYSEKETT